MSELDEIGARPRRGKRYMWLLGAVVLLLLIFAGYAMVRRPTVVTAEPAGSHIGR